MIVNYDENKVDIQDRFDLFFSLGSYPSAYDINFSYITHVTKKQLIDLEKNVSRHDSHYKRGKIEKDLSSYDDDDLFIMSNLKGYEQCRTLLSPTFHNWEVVKRAASLGRIISSFKQRDVTLPSGDRFRMTDLADPSDILGTPSIVKAERISHVRKKDYKVNKKKTHIQVFYNRFQDLKKKLCNDCLEKGFYFNQSYIVYEMGVYNKETKSTKISATLETVKDIFMNETIMV